MVSKVINFDGQQAMHEAQFYAGLGWFPTPGKAQSKVPMKGKGWSQLDLDGFDQIMQQFHDIEKGSPFNVGLLVGKQMVDIDLDSANSRELAPYILPPTLKLKKGDNITHYLYHLDEGLDPIPSKPFPKPTQDKQAKEMLVEVRGIDSRGNYQYTLASGSIHPSGVKIGRVGKEEDIHTIKKHDDIYNMVRLLAFCDVMVDQWGEGSRNNMSMGICGFLLKNGYHEDDVEAALTAICSVAGDEENRLKQFHSTVAKFDNGEPVAGEKILKETLPSFVFEKVKSWFGDIILALEDFSREEIFAERVETRWPYLTYVVNLDRFTCDGQVILKKTALHDLFARQLSKGDRSKIIAMCHKVDGINYFPNRPLVVQEKTQTFWNSWNPPKLKPVDGDVSLFLEHVSMLCDNEEEPIEHLISFMAHAVQKPEQKVRWMPLLIGCQGTGKSTIGEILMQVVGGSNFVSIPAADMLGNFNTPIKNKIVVLIEEMRISRSSQTTALATALKEKITNDHMLVKEKNIPEYTINNRIRFIGTSNHAAPIEIEKGDRRYYIIKSLNTGEEQTYRQQSQRAAWFAKYYDWLLNQDGYGKILNYLRQYDISRFTADKAPAMSKRNQKEKAEIVRQTTELEFANETADLLQSVSKEMDIVSFRDLKELFDSEFPNYRVSDIRFSRVLNTIPNIRVFGKVMKIDGKSTKVKGVYLVGDAEKRAEPNDLELAKLLTDQGSSDKEPEF